MILIISSPSDVHAQAVLRELSATGNTATLLDLSAFPQRMRLSWRQHDGARAYELCHADGCVIDLAAHGVIWWRRPQPFALHESITDPDYRQFAYAEIQEAFMGMWHALEAFWINNPGRDEIAHRKVYQLRLAQEVGLPTPRTLITSDPAHARDFAAELGVERTVYKAFSATEQNWRETRLLRPGELELIDNVRYAPVIFQEYIPAQVDLRITVVGEQIFAAAIHSQQTAYAVDMRMDIAHARMEPWELPALVQHRLHAFMTRLGLAYGAIDMRLTPDGEYVFLEINPAGQWLFIEEVTRQPIAAAMARLMVEMDRRPRGRSLER